MAELEQSFLDEVNSTSLCHFREALRNQLCAFEVTRFLFLPEDRNSDNLSSIHSTTSTINWFFCDNPAHIELGLGFFT